MKEKGRHPDRGRQPQARVRKYLVYPARDGISDERWRTEGGGAVQVDSRSAPGRDEGGGGSGYEEKY